MSSFSGIPSTDSTPERQNSDRFTRDVVIVEVEGRRFGVDIYQIEEIIPMVKPKPVVKAPNHIEGVINLRGSLIPVVKLGKILNLSRKSIDPDMFVIINCIAQTKMGLIVDNIEKTARVTLHGKSSHDHTMDSYGFEGIAELGGELIEVLDLRDILSNLEKPRLLNDFTESDYRFIHDDFEHESVTPSVDERSERILKDRAESLAKTSMQEKKEHEKWMLFSLNEKDYAVNSVYVDEVIGNFKVTSLPSMPLHCLGIISLRGDILPILDPKRILGLDAASTEDMVEKKAVVILREDQRKTGFLVDEVKKNINMDSNRVQTPLAAPADLSAQIIIGHVITEDGLLVLLDGAKMVTAGSTQKSDTITSTSESTR